MEIFAHKKTVTLGFLAVSCAVQCCLCCHALIITYNNIWDLSLPALMSHHLAATSAEGDNGRVAEPQLLSEGNQTPQGHQESRVFVCDFK